MRSPAVRWCADRRGLADEAADRIRAAVLAGRYAPGAALRESELAALLDVSRGSVREGMALLAREELIRSGWHRGTTIIDVTAADVEEVYALRAAPVALGVAFHHHAHAAAGNTRLTAAWRTIRSQVHLFHRRRAHGGAGAPPWARRRGAPRDQPAAARSARHRRTAGPLRHRPRRGGPAGPALGAVAGTTCLRCTALHHHGDGHAQP